jgi:hypothetical protein
LWIIVLYNLFGFEYVEDEKQFCVEYLNVNLDVYPYTREEHSLVNITQTVSCKLILDIWHDSNTLQKNLFECETILFECVHIKAS